MKKHQKGRGGKAEATSGSENMFFSTTKKSNGRAFQDERRGKSLILIHNQWIGALDWRAPNHADR